MHQPDNHFAHTFCADFHIHSHFSIATSKQLNPEHLDLWARLKGIRVVGTGDFTHPGWVKELEAKLIPAEPGLFRLRDELRIKTAPPWADMEIHAPRFILTAEISNIYKFSHKLRKVHNLIFAPSFAVVHRIQQKLLNLKANISSDGRPIIGLDSRDLLELALEADEHIFFVPAHIWTPWFSALGARSGFDSIQECYRDLSHHIHAVETGLSTDPPMNWVCSQLDPFTLISNSDAHSPEKLGRNANLLSGELTYSGIVSAMGTDSADHFAGTIDLFPQEGKYHFDGHRKCRISSSPMQSLETGSICPECSKPLTMGVTTRVARLSDRTDPLLRPARKPFYSIVPLKEILSEIAGCGAASKKVQTLYARILQSLGPELDVLLKIPAADIHDKGFPELARGIARMRSRRVQVKAGFDGEYGSVKVLPFQNQSPAGCTGPLFDLVQEDSPTELPAIPLLGFDLAGYHGIRKKEPVSVSAKRPEKKVFQLNPRQQAACTHHKGPALILAGPGSGKTRVIAERTAFLINEKQADPASILIVTFAVKAAGEIFRRIRSIPGLEEKATRVTTATFHSLGLRIMRENPTVSGWNGQSALIDNRDREWILKHILGHTSTEASLNAKKISCFKASLHTSLNDAMDMNTYSDYQAFLQSNNLFDMEDLLFIPWNMLNSNPDIQKACNQRFQWIMVDEYQDINLTQYKLLRQLAPGPDPNLVAVGDPNQAIYGFRGADVTLIDTFSQEFAKAPRFLLTTSYRCSDITLQASSQVIGIPASSDDMLSGLFPGISVHIRENSSAASEAEFIARTIESMVGGLRFFSMDSQLADGNEADQISSLRDICVLCRSRSIMAPLQKAFADHAIPCQTVAETPFYHAPPLCHLTDLYKLAMNPAQRFLRLRLSCVPGFSDISAADLKKAARLKPVNALKFLSGLWPGCADHETELKRLLDLADSFRGHKKEFLQFLNLSSAPDSFADRFEGVALLTMHAAKGLEFQKVFIAGCEDSVIPFTLPGAKKTDEAEERRLLYVAMTRCRSELYLTYARKRSLFGTSRSQNRSPFIDEIEKTLFDFNRVQPPAEKEKHPTQLKLFDF